MVKKEKQTPLYDEHLALGARMVNFHGWLMPLSYRGITEEVKAVRERAGLFDLSHMGEILLSGEEALSFLQFMTPNDASILKSGQMQYSLFLNEQGEVLDDFMLYKLGDLSLSFLTPDFFNGQKRRGKFMSVVNASNTEKIFNHLQEQKSKKVGLINLTEALALIGLQGPNSKKIFQQVVDEDLDEFKFLYSREFNLGGETVLVSRSGYTGEDGFEIYAGRDKVGKIWDLLMETGRPFGLEPVGLGARDILRTEMGYPLYGQEWAGKITPWEAGFSWVVKLNKDFLGKTALAEKKDKISQSLVAFVMKEKAVPRHGYSIKVGERKIGRVTSGTFSPTRGDFIGLGYVLKDFIQAGGEIFIEIRGKLIPAEIVKLPFVTPRVKH